MSSCNCGAYVTCTCTAQAITVIPQSPIVVSVGTGQGGAVGPQGTQGIAGAGVQGAIGIQGPVGAQGLQGDEGPQGVQGFNGIQGVQGFQGTQGIQGTQGQIGVQGFQGNQGTQGSQGEQGVQGAMGAQGLQGVQGAQGAQGTQGSQGETGVQGVQGVQGIQGVQGAQGTQGVQGFQGTTGIQGNVGIQGTQGLQGNQGVQGVTGVQGLSGTQGTQGVQGQTGAGGTIAYYGVFQDTQDQSVPSVNTPTPFLLRTTDHSFGVSVTSNGSGALTRIKFDNNGTYNIQFSAQLSHTGGGGTGETVHIWFRKNGVDVPNSNTLVTVRPDNPFVVASWNFVDVLLDNDYYEIYWKSDNANIRLEASPATANSPYVPSIIVTATMVAYTLQGTTGAQGAAGFMGSNGAQGTQGVQGNQGVQGFEGGGLYTFSATAPLNPTVGDRWINSNTGREYTYVYDGNSYQWVDTRPSGYIGAQGPAGVDASTVPNVLYVAKNGNDANNGTSLGTAKLTIKAALAIAAADTAVYVKSGDYTEQNPVTIPAKVSIIGDSARTTTIRPANPTQDIFYVNNASYVTGVTFKDHVSPAAAIAFNPNGSAGTITQSPYVFDCSSLTTTGTGMRIDGAVVGGGKSMLAGQFTQINLGGKGIHILNRGYAQLISIYTICCDVSVLCESGGFCSLIGSDTSFGNYGLKSVGVSELLYSGTATGALANSNQITITGLPHTPYVNNVVSFDNGVTYYAVDSVTIAVGGSSVVTLDQRLTENVSSGATARFYQASKIMASNHTFEYCGSGIDLVNARPQFGGIPIQENEVVEESGGQIYYTSTDHKGDFRIGSELKIDRGSGAIAGIAFDRSLFAVLTPYILALEG